MKKYTIGEIADKMKINAFTIRFYEKKGLLPFTKEITNKGGILKITT